MPQPKINDYTTASQYNYNPTGYQTFGTRGQTLADADLSVNAQREYMTFRNALGSNKAIAMPGGEFSNIFDSDDIGVVSEVRDWDQDNLMRVLFRKRVDQNVSPTGNRASVESYNDSFQDITDPHRGTTIEMAAAYANKPLADMFKEQYGATQLPVVYISPSNGDQIRRWGTIVTDATPDSGFRKAITNYTIEAWDQEEGANDGATVIPAGDIGDETNLYFPAKDAEFFGSGKCDCQPLTGKCANGYRIAWILKQNNFTPGSKPVREMVTITNMTPNPLGNGGVLITIKRGLGKRNPQEGQFTEGLPVDIEAGDTIIFGPVVPSTQCLPKACCTKAFQKPYQYCDVTQAMTECVFHDKPHIRLTQSKDRFHWSIEERREAAQIIRDFMFKLYHNIMFGQCDSIPHTTRGMLQSIDQFGFLDEHYFTSCYDQCGQYKLGRIHQLRMRSMGAARAAKKSGWILAGDSRELAKYQNQMQSTNFVAQNPQMAQMQQNMNNSGFAPESSKSILGEIYNTDPADIDTLRFQDKDVLAINDSSFKNYGLEGTMYWMNVDSGLEIFTRDVDALTNLSGFSSTQPYFPTTGVRGFLVPYLYSQSLVPTQNIIAGTNEMRSNKNCGFDINAYMEYGVHVKAAYLVHSGRFRYGARMKNPEYDPGEPESEANPSFIYTRLGDLDCSCGASETSIANAFNGWGQGANLPGYNPN